MFQTFQKVSPYICIYFHNCLSKTYHNMHYLKEISVQVINNSQKIPKKYLFCAQLNTNIYVLNILEGFHYICIYCHIRLSKTYHNIHYLKENSTQIINNPQKIPKKQLFYAQLNTNIHILNVLEGFSLHMYILPYSSFQDLP